MAFMHNHLSDGWQGMSEPDVIAERDRIGFPSRATGLPLVGLTLGTDEAWSARFWTWDGHKLNRSWCVKVRVVGKRLRVTYNDKLYPPPKRRQMLLRTTDTWGVARQNDLSRVRIGIVGVGSVGCMVAESLARMGMKNLVLIDPDRVERHNLDRLLYAGQADVGKFKASLAARHLRKSATAEAFQVDTHLRPLQEQSAYQAALDCDVLFSAVDRPLPKDLVNRISYAHCIPVISGGIYIENKPTGELTNALWSVTVAGPHRRCLRCDGQYTSSDVMMEQDGSLDEPSYVRASGAEQAPTNQNVFAFSANVASFMVIEMVRLMVSEAWWPDRGGKLEYSLVQNRLRHQVQSCENHCSIYDLTAQGDRYSYPFLLDTPEIKLGGVIARMLSCLREWRTAISRTLRRRG